MGQPGLLPAGGTLRPSFLRAVFPFLGLGTLESQREALDSAPKNALSSTGLGFILCASLDPLETLVGPEHTPESHPFPGVRQRSAPGVGLARPSRARPLRPTPASSPVARLGRAG